MEQTTVDINNDDTTVEKPTTGISPPNESESKCSSCVKLLDYIVWKVVFFILVAVYVPCFLIYAAGAWIICAKDVTEDSDDEGDNPQKARVEPRPVFKKLGEWFLLLVSGKEAEDSKEEDPASYYNKAKQAGKAAKKLARSVKLLQIRALILVLVWLTLNLTIPQLKAKLLLGCELWKWSLLVAIASCGYTLISMATALLLTFLWTLGPIKSRKNFRYFAESLRQSINFIILFWSILVMWIFYFKTTHGLKKAPDVVAVLHILSWTFATLAIGAVLWLVKNTLLLMWESDVVYRRFRDRIVSAGFQLYFLKRICEKNSRDLDVFKPRNMPVVSNQNEVHHQGNIEEDDQPGDEGAAGDPKDIDNTKEQTEEKTRKAKEDLLIEPLVVQSRCVNKLRDEGAADDIENIDNTKEETEEKKRKAKENLLIEPLVVQSKCVNKLGDEGAAGDTKDIDNTKEQTGEKNRKAKENLLIEPLVVQSRCVNKLEDEGATGGTEDIYNTKEQTKEKKRRAKESLLLEPLIVQSRCVNKPGDEGTAGDTKDIDNTKEQTEEKKRKAKEKLLIGPLVVQSKCFNKPKDERAAGDTKDIDSTKEQTEEKKRKAKENMLIEPRVAQSRGVNKPEDEGVAGDIEDIDNTRKAKEDIDNTKEQMEEKKRKAKENLLNERVKLYEGATTYDITKMTEYLLHLSKISSREDDGTSEISNKCKQINPRNDTKVYITTADLKTFWGEDDSKLLFQDLCREHQLEDSEKISYENFEKSMVIGHKNCVALGHTLSDAMAAVNVLNKVMSVTLITIAVIAWLLLTDIASDKILVLIASPFLAATFMFGDTCKKTFEGLIFSFVNHPFDVGDQCIIDGIQLEVKRMGILTTAFMLIATKEEALYPNSDLATKSIINLKGEPNPNDRVELKLDISCTPKIAQFEKKIHMFFEEDKFEGAPTITVEEIGSCVKMTIQYRHVLSIHEVTHSQCYEKKRKQRSELLRKIADCINEIGIKMAE